MNKKAITLVELIVAMTISILLMASIGVFISSGMQNLFLQQKSLKNMSDIIDFSNDLKKTLDYANHTGQIKKIGSGIIFKKQKEYDIGGFSYIGTSLEENLFCSGADVEDNETNHIFIKNFIPFFENGETELKETLTASFGNYVSYQKEHKIEKGGEIIVGKGVFGNNFRNGIEAKDLYLNSPTGMSKIGGKLYFSDTLNNRVLYLSGTQVYKFLDETDGLYEPTGLLYDKENKSLYLSNSAAGEILKISSKKYSSGENLTFSGSFKVESNVSNISKMEVSFFRDSNSGSLKFPTSTGSFSFEGIEQKEDFLTGSNNVLTYYFSDFTEELLNTPKGNCSSEGEKIIKKPYLDNGEVKKQIEKCEKILIDGPDGNSTPSFQNKIITYGSKNNIFLENSQEYKISIDDIKVKSDTKAGNYFVEIKFLKENGYELYKKIFPFFVQGDRNLETTFDNTIEIYKKDLSYPNGIWGNGDSDFNNFDISNFSDYKIDRKNDIILKTPVENLEINKNTSGNLLNFILKYYRNFNCYNLGENNEKIKTFLLKKDLK